MSPASGGTPSGAELAGLAVVLAVVVVIPLVGGVLLDGARHTSPLFFMVGLLVGIAAAVGLIYTRFVRRYS
jgi:F0F1-type ATP synthase assembly protein I